MLPTWLDADAQPPAFDPSLRNASAEAQLKQFNDALTQFLPYDWSASWDISLKTLLAQPASLAALMAWASAESPEDLPQLALLADGTALQDTDAKEAGSLAIELCMKHFDVTYSDSVAALAMLQEQTSRAVMEFSTHSFPRFTRSKACLSLSQALRGPARPAVDARPDLIWSGYEVPEDYAGWLYASVEGRVPPSQFRDQRHVNARESHDLRQPNLLQHHWLREIRGARP